MGPGLGREERTQSIGRVAVEVARSQGKYIVIDADGLWLIQHEPNLIKGYERAVLTPNVVEFKRLCDAMVRLNEPYIHLTSGREREARLTGTT